MIAMTSLLISFRCEIFPPPPPHTYPPIFHYSDGFTGDACPPGFSLVFTMESFLPQSVARDTQNPVPPLDDLLWPLAFCQQDYHDPGCSRSPSVVPIHPLSAPFSLRRSSNGANIPTLNFRTEPAACSASIAPSSLPFDASKKTMRPFPRARLRSDPLHFFPRALTPCRFLRHHLHIAF